MKVSKKNLRRIVVEMLGHDMMAYEAEEHARDEIATQIRNASKDIHGRKDVYDLTGKSMEELEDILYDLANSQEQQSIDDTDRDEMEDQMGRDHDLSRAEMAPRRQGMSRRPGGRKSQRRMESKMKVSESQIRRIIRESLLKEYYGQGGGPRNDLPPRSSNYYKMAKALDIGTLDLDNIAYDLGFRDFRDMDISITPKALAERDPESFVVAVQDSSAMGMNMGPNEILELVGAEGRVY